MAPDDDAAAFGAAWSTRLPFATSLPAAMIWLLSLGCVSLDLDEPASTGRVSDILAAGLYLNSCNERCEREEAVRIV